MGDYGFKVSKDGENVLTCDDEDLVFSSGFDNLIRKTSGTASITDNTTVAHGLAYNPVFFHLFSRDDDRYKMYGGGIDATNLLLEDMGGTTRVRYYIFYHTGA